MGLLPTVRYCTTFLVGGMLLVMKFVARTLVDTKQFAERAVHVLQKVAWIPDRAVVVGLSGDLGVGKTTFVQCVAEVLGVTDTVTSPTFVLRSEYDTADSTFKHLVHIDAYRLETLTELDTIGWDTILATPHTLIMVEWINTITDRIPPNTFFITFSICDEGRVFVANLFDD